ncbi:hypothetical protein LNQ49_00280 [Flavobacterium sp. F-65]|uniref:Uncharacterized protein n=1 Tax=Flavobacterium pisciphilum TaxID=2893755 RepID=A0ABS8MMP0_9FLAO|nr:hypothetical protein [Flavobacterium sp. F-65]MCC9070040.1 hypothetical protein [Flavobacterium sp. F-65]
MDLEIIKTKFLKNEELSHEEVLLVLEDMIETVLGNGKFDNKMNAFYTSHNYSLILATILENKIEVPSDLDFKLENVNRFAKKEHIKNAQIARNLGVFLIAFSIIYYFLTDGQIMRYSIIVLVVGLLFLFKGVDKLKKLR